VTRGWREKTAGSCPTCKTSHAAEKSAVTLATPNIPNCAEDGVAAGGGLRAQGAADVVKGGEGVDGLVELVEGDLTEMNPQFEGSLLAAMR